MKNQRSGHQWLSRTAIFSLLTVTNVFSVSESFVVRSPAALTRRKNSAEIIQNRGAHIQLTTLQMVAKSGGKIISSEEQFEEAALSKSLPRPVMVFFTAPWCGPCRLSVPVVKEVMKEYADQIDCCEVCTDDFPEIASSVGVVSIPTIQIYYKGEVQDTIVGCVAKKVLSMAVGKILEDSCDGEEAPNGDNAL